MKKVFIFLLLLYTAISATTVDMKPKYTLKATGGVQDMVYSKNKLYAATDNGTVEIFNIKNRKTRTSRCRIMPAEIFHFINKLNRSFFPIKIKS